MSSDEITRPYNWCGVETASPGIGLLHCDSMVGNARGSRYGRLAFPYLGFPNLKQDISSSTGHIGISFGARA